MKRKGVARQHPSPLDNLLEPIVHCLYKEHDGSLLFAQCYLTGIPTIEFWKRLYAGSHAGWLECYVRYIIGCSLRTTLLIKILT